MSGVYDSECSMVRNLTHAAGTVLIVIGGERGSGFSAHMPPQLGETLPKLLRDLADALDAGFEYAAAIKH